MKFNITQGFGDFLRIKHEIEKLQSLNLAEEEDLQKVKRREWFTVEDADMVIERAIKLKEEVKRLELQQIEFNKVKNEVVRYLKYLESSLLQVNVDGELA